MGIIMFMGCSPLAYFMKLRKGGCVVPGENMTMDVIETTHHRGRNGYFGSRSPKGARGQKRPSVDGRVTTSQRKSWTFALLAVVPAARKQAADYVGSLPDWHPLAIQRRLILVKNTAVKFRNDLSSLTD